MPSMCVFFRDFPYTTGLCSHTREPNRGVIRSKRGKSTVSPSVYVDKKVEMTFSLVIRSIFLYVHN
jgi:hypothetical protein